MSNNKDNLVEQLTNSRLTTLRLRFTRLTKDQVTSPAKVTKCKKKVEKILKRNDFQGVPI